MSYLNQPGNLTGVQKLESRKTPWGRVDIWPDGCENQAKKLYSATIEALGEKAIQEPNRLPW